MQFHTRSDIFMGNWANIFKKEHFSVDLELFYSTGIVLVILVARAILTSMASLYLSLQTFKLSKKHQRHLIITLELFHFTLLCGILTRSPYSDVASMVF